MKDRNLTSFVYSAVTDPHILDAKHRAIIDFILAHAENDERPYLEVEILGQRLLGLLDSGATHTVIGGPGWRRLQTLGLPINKQDMVTCSVANGGKCKSLGSVLVPFQLKDRFRMISVLVVPDFPHTLILGQDFWRRMGIVPDLRRNNWTFSNSEPCTAEISVQSQSSLTSEQTQVLQQLVDKAFSDMGDKLGCTTLVEHEIKTSSPPIKQRYYPVSPFIQAQIDLQLKQLLVDDVIEKSTSPWSSPIVLVKKKDGAYRFCVDYRKLNQVTERDAYPLPYISATLDKLRNAQYLSSLDIKSAYFQVPLLESSRPLTAFTVPNRGLYQFKRLPMGLANSPATFQRLIDRVIGPDLEPHCFVYLDDIVVVTSTFDEHIQVLSEVFRRLISAGLTVAQDKCRFCRSELRFLGYIVDSSGLHVDPEKVSAILNIPSPSNVTEVRRFLGMASWYRRFLPNFSTLIAPLSNLLRKNRKFQWDSVCEEAFQSAKEHLIKAPVLSCPDFTLPFVIQTDASGYGIGAVLTQQIGDNEKVICYLSRSLNKNERNYSTTERECLAVLWAIEKLRPYVEGSKFTVVTDHYSLVWLNRLQSPAGRLARWAVKLQQYDYEIIHRKGREHVVPDALSRSVPIVDFLQAPSVEPADANELKVSDDCWFNSLRSKVLKSPRKYSQWRIEGLKLFKKCMPRYPDLSAESDFWREVVPKSSRQKLMEEAHTSTCHVGVYKTFNRLASQYYWPKMRCDVASFVRRCRICQAIKPEQKKPAGLLLSTQSTVTRPFELLCADLVGPLPRSSSGHQYIFVVADVFSKFALLYPLRKATAAIICKLLDLHVLSVFGSPNHIIVDNGVQFRSREFVDLMRSHNIGIKYTALYHPQANPCERVNKVIKTMIRSYVADTHKNWDKDLARVGWAIRSVRHEVTGLTPNFIVFGRELPDRGSPTDQTGPIQVARRDVKSRSEALDRVYKDVTTRLARSYEQNRKVYNLRHRDEQFRVDQLVWRKNYVLSDAAKYFTAKLAPRFIGPFTIAKRVSPWTYELRDSDGNSVGTWHAKDLKAHPPDE